MGSTCVKTVYNSVDGAVFGYAQCTQFVSSAHASLPQVSINSRFIPRYPTRLSTNLPPRKMVCFKRQISSFQQFPHTLLLRLLFIYKERNTRI